MQLLSIGIDERDQNARAALYRKARLRKADGLDIIEKTAGNILFLNYISKEPYDKETLTHINEKLHGAPKHYK